MCFGENPKQDVNQAPKTAERNTGKITAAGEENYCLGDPEIQGQLCLTN